MLSEDATQFINQSCLLQGIQNRASAYQLIFIVKKQSTSTAGSAFFSTCSGPFPLSFRRMLSDETGLYPEASPYVTFARIRFVPVLTP